MLCESDCSTGGGGGVAVEDARDARSDCTSFISAANVAPSTCAAVSRAGGRVTALRRAGKRRAGAAMPRRRAGGVNARAAGGEARDGMGLDD